MLRLNLYHTTGCHLCEEAEALVAECLAEWGIALDCLGKADIADDGELSQRYGILIPVLREEETGLELHWPFEAEAVHGLLREAFAR